MAVKKVESFNIHETPAINQNEFDVETYLNANWEKTKEAVNNNAEELMQAQKDISTLKEDNKTNKSSIDVLKKSNETRDEKISKNTEDIEAIQGSIKTATETINKKDNEQDEDIKANKETIKEIQAENERLRNDIKSIAVVNEVSGENIHIEDSSDARCEIEIGGNHQQETREGYNQFKITSTTTKSAGVLITKNDESSVSYQGTTTGMFTHMLVEYDGNGLEITKQMYLKAFGNLTNANFSVKIIKSGETEPRYLRFSPDLILDVGDILQQVYVQQQNTGILVSGTLQVLLTDYENKDKPYEQYGASPSFAYSSTVKVVGDDINEFDKNNMNVVSGAFINSTTMKIESNQNRKCFYMEITPGEVYTISRKKVADMFAIGTTNEVPQIGSDVIDVNYNNQEITIIKTSSNANYLVCYYKTKSSDVESDIVDKIKIQKGSNATPYSSYNCGSTQIDIQNRNVLNPQIDEQLDDIKVINQDDMIIINGNNAHGHQINFKKKINYKPNTNYKVTITKVSGTCTEYSPGR